MWVDVSNNQTANWVPIRTVIGYLVTESGNKLCAENGAEIVLEDATPVTAYWLDIPNTQTPNWQHINSTQTFSWVSINDVQSPNWTDISTA